MRLLHYTTAPFRFNPRLRYRGDLARGYKPVGLWVSVEGDDDWKQYCESESYQFCSRNHVSEIRLRPENNVLIVDTLSALDAFDRRWNVDRDSYRGIPWETIMDAYDGIIIAPYQWERRLEFLWYYTWDCASGCIWNLDAIEQVHELEMSANGTG